MVPIACGEGGGEEQPKARGSQKRGCMEQLECVARVCWWCGGEALSRHGCGCVCGTTGWLSNLNTSAARCRRFEGGALGQGSQGRLACTLLAVAPLKRRSPGMQRRLPACQQRSQTAAAGSVPLALHVNSTLLNRDRSAEQAGRAGRHDEYGKAGCGPGQGSDQPHDAAHPAGRANPCSGAEISSNHQQSTAPQARELS